MNVWTRVSADEKGRDRQRQMMFLRGCFGCVFSVLVEYDAYVANAGGTEHSGTVDGEGEMAFMRDLGPGMMISDLFLQLK